MPQTETKFDIGEDLYGVSIAELETRMEVLTNEISRIERELLKKQKEFSAADNLFAQKPQKG